MLLRVLSVRRRTTISPVSRYQNRTQTSQVFENGVWRDSWDAREGLSTKKADVETGEDQKGV